MDEESLTEHYEELLAEARDHAARLAAERDDALDELDRIRCAINELLDFADET